MAILAPLLLFAARHDLRSLSEGFRSRSIEDNAFEAVVVAGILVAICVTLLLVGRFARRFENLKSYDSPPELFRELCRVHRLNWSSRRLLKRLAADWQMPIAASVFVEPERFNTARLPAEWEQRTEQVERIRSQLFDTP